MRTKTMMLGGLIMAIVAAAPAAAQRISESVALGSGDELDIDLRTGGSVTITGGGGSLEVTGEIRGRDADRVEVTVESTSRGARITSDGDGNNIRANVTLEVSVPNDVVVDLRTMGGDVVVEDARLELSGKSMGGDVRIEDSQVTLRFTTMGGDVFLRDAELDGRMKSMGGDLTFVRVSGSLDATTMGGDMDLDEVGRGIRVDTMGGNVTVGSAHDDLEVESKGGDIRMVGIEAGLKAITFGGDIEVRLEPGGARDVLLESKGGDITLSVPDGIGADVEIEVEYTKDSRRTYRIESDFALDREESAEWEYRHGEASKTIRASGSIGSGGSTITLRTVNGDVRLVRR